MRRLLVLPGILTAAPAFAHGTHADIVGGHSHTIEFTLAAMVLVVIFVWRAARRRAIAAQSDG